MKPRIRHLFFIFFTLSGPFLRPFICCIRELLPSCRILIKFSENFKLSVATNLKIRYADGESARERADPVTIHYII